MAIVDVGEQAQGREGVKAQIGRRLYRRHFYVETDDPHTAQISVEQAPGIPVPYQHYKTEDEEDIGAVCRSVIATQRDNTRLVWDVLVEYDTEFDRKDNPLTEPPDITCDSEVYDQPLPGRAAIFYNPHSPSPESEDPNADDHQNESVKAWGQGIINSAGEPFDPPPTVQRSRPIVTFAANYPTFLVAHKVLFEDTTNSKPWSGLQARQAWLRSIKATSHVQKSTKIGEADIFYFRVEYVFALKADTWDLQLLDIGSYYLEYPSESGGKPIRKNFKTASGEPRLGLLDHSNSNQPGKKLAFGQPAQFLRWRTRRELDYNALGINLNLALSQRLPRRR